jgi:undecaprenyl-diphosphatase
VLQLGEIHGGDRTGAGGATLMAVVVAAALAVIQGVFMFVPVSSTSHLALAQHLLDHWGVELPAPESAEMILFDLVLHLGTVASIVFVMRHRLRSGSIRLASELREALDGGSRTGGPAVRFLGLIAVATLVTGVLGLGIRQLAPTVFANPAAIAVMLVITGGLLWWTDVARTGAVSTAQIGLAMAVAIGVAQSIALVPGLSRSGLTIAAALALGLRRGTAAEFSFVLAIPTIIAATGVQWLLVAGDGEPITIGLPEFAVGFAVAAVVGAVALRVVLTLLHAARFRVFTPYVWSLAVLVLVVSPEL